MKHAILLGLLVLSAACNDASKGASSASAAPASDSAKPAAKADKPAASGTAAASASAAAPAGGADLAVLGGPDWKQAFVGAPPIELPMSHGGGQGSGVADDYTRQTAHAKDWKFNAAGGGGVYWGASKKAFMISNINLKQDPTQKTVDLWIKSGLVKDVKHTGGPEVAEIGPNKALGLTGAGTCTLKDGEAADFYWHDLYSPGDFAHELSIVVVAKDAPEDEKKVALTLLRQIKYTDKAKPYYKKG